MASATSGLSSLEEELLEAVKASNVEKVKISLNKGASVNSIVYPGQTILGRAVQIGCLEVIDTLLNYAGDSTLQQASPVSPDSPLDMSTIFWEPSAEIPSTAQNEEPSGLCLFRSLHRYHSKRHHHGGADVNLSDFYDRMPIHYASEQGNPEVLALLLKAGCRVNISDSDNITPLHLAVGRGHLEVTRMLLKAGSRVNSKTSDKASALHIAASHGYAEIVNLLLDYDAKIDLLDASDRTPLLLATNRAHIEVANLLIRRGAAVNIEEIHGYTPLSEAVWLRQPQLVETLLSAGAKVSSSHHLAHFCVAHGCLRSLRLLLSSPGSGLPLANRRDDAGDTPMHLAIRTGRLDYLQLLLNYEGNVNITNGISGQSLLHEAVEALTDLDTFRSALELLLRWGSHLNKESYTPGDSGLYRCLLLDKFGFAKELIREGANPNIGKVFTCNIDNLFLAVKKGHFPLVKLLVYAGFQIKKATWIDLIPPDPADSSLPPTTIKSWLAYMKKNPMSLASLCRLKIRCLLRTNISYKLKFLRLPHIVQDFLLFKEYDHCAFLSSPHPHS